MKIARVYIRVSTDNQDLTRQQALIERAKEQGYYVAKVYSEKESGTLADRPALNEMIQDLQNGDVVVAENIDRISRLPLPEAEKLIERIQSKGAILAIPGILDLSQIQMDSEVSKIVLESVQSILLKVALYYAREDYLLRRNRQIQGIKQAKSLGKYRGRRPNYNLHRQVFALRKSGMSIEDTAKTAGCGIAQVSRIMRQYQTFDDIPT